MKQISDALKTALSMRAAEMGYTVHKHTENSRLFDIEKGGEYLCSILQDGNLVYNRNTEFEHEIHDLNAALWHTQEVFALFDRYKSKSIVPTRPSLATSNSTGHPLRHWWSCGITLMHRSNLCKQSRLCL